MTTIPRTFCISLRETPKRKEEAIKYFNQVGLKVEMFDGIHGESFGLKTAIPNHSVLPGREYFITSGHVGHLLSHLMLWNVLINQPEDEFFVIEDDVILCDDFFEKFTKSKLELPVDWEMVYVGWLSLEENNVKESPTHISNNIVITKPACTHSYLVKKSALKVLIETNQLAWHQLDIQIVERSLPKLHHYAFNPPLINQRSVCSVKDEVWYSLCYDWDLNPEWISTSKTNNIRLGNGWHPLEKNADGYMIWSDGRGEFIFDDKWETMKIDFIAEGDIEKKLRVICPQQPDQVFDIIYDKNTLSFPINGAGSVILVSDTFRPVDIYKTSDCRRLGLRLLKDITLTDITRKESIINLYSMYGAKREKESLTSSGVKINKVKYNHTDGKINISGQISYNYHRSGWEMVIKLLSEYHRDDATLFDTWLERTFAWEKNRNSELRLIPYREPWIGVFHHPPNTPNWCTENATPNVMIQSKEFQESLPTCKGIYVLSKYHQDFLKCFVKNVPIEVLYLPTEIPKLKFNFDEFINNNNKKIINIGWWCRKLSSIYQLEVDRSIYQKIRLFLPTTHLRPGAPELILEIEKGFRGTELSEDMKRSVIDVRYMPNDEYDDLLSKNIVFLDLYDANANNAIIECIARGTPILVNPLPAVVEYLGEKYPFYFTTLEEASKKIKNIALIKITHEYLLDSNLIEKITGEYFIKIIREGQIWKSLT